MTEIYNGNEESIQEPTAIKDPSTGEVITDPIKIKSESLKFCSKLLKNRDPRLEFKEDVDAKILLHEIRMTERVENDVEELTVEMFNKAMKTVWQKKGEKYDFIIKGGYDLKNAIFSLFKKVWNEETIPRRWTETTLL